MPTPRVQAVIFDYGNVLARTVDPRPRAYWEQQLGLAPGLLQRLVHNETSWIAAQRGQITADAHWHAVGHTLRLSGEVRRALRDAFYQGDAVNTALLTRIEALRRTGLLIALLSNFSTDLRHLLSKQNLLRYFDYIGISAELGIMKPDAAAYQAVIDRLALPAAACLFVDDLPANVAAAQALGMHGLVFDGTDACLQTFDQLCTTP